MNLPQIIDALPPQVYVRRGELVIHFSTPADLVSRLAETSAALADVDRQTVSGGRRGCHFGGPAGTTPPMLSSGDRDASALNWFQGNDVDSPAEGPENWLGKRITVF